MNYIKHTITDLFNSKAFLYILLILVILKQSYFSIAIQDYYPDLCRQISASYNWIINGKFGFEFADLENLSRTKFVPLVGWPLGFPILLRIFTYLSGDIILAKDIVLVLSIVLLFVSLNKMLDLLKVKKSIKVLFYLTFIFSNPVIKYLTLTELVALALYLFAIWFFINWSHKQKMNYWRTAIISCIWFLPSFVRYDYIPITFILPFVLFLLFLVQKWSGYLRYSVLSFLLLVTFNVVQYKLDNKVGENSQITVMNDRLSTNMNNFETLAHTSPFVIQVFTDAMSYGNLIYNFEKCKKLNLLLLAISFIIIFLILFQILFRENLFQKLGSHNPKILLLLFLIITIIINALFLLSLSYTLGLNGAGYAHVTLTRYWTPAMIMILLYFFNMVNKSRFFLVFFFIWIFYLGIVEEKYLHKTYSVLIGFKTMSYYFEPKKHDFIEVNNSLKELQEEQCSNLVYATYKPSLSLASLQDCRLIENWSDLLVKDTLVSSEDLILVIDTLKAPELTMNRKNAENFLEKHHVEKYKDLFIIKLGPNYDNKY